MSQLDLPKTKLSLKDEVLEKYNNDDSVAASFSINDISEISVEESKEYSITLIFCAALVGLTWVARTYITSPGWSWTAIIACMAMICFSFLMITVHKIQIVTKNGKVAYTISDSVEEAEGFALSLSHIIEFHKK